MNEKFIAYNFEEIEEEVQIVLDRLKKGISEADFHHAVQHIYHHLNTAWNARDSEPGVVFDTDDPQMDQWKEFPNDIKLI